MLFTVRDCLSGKYFFSSTPKEVPHKIYTRAGLGEPFRNAHSAQKLQLLVGTMIKDQPLFIKGVDETNQELMKESAFGAMGMFTFIFTSSVIYQCLHRNKNDEDTIRCQGYMRPSHQMAMSDYQVEMPHAYSYRDDPGNIVHHSDGEEDGGDETEEDDEGETAHQEIDLLS